MIADSLKIDILREHLRDASSDLYAARWPTDGGLLTGDDLYEYLSAKVKYEVIRDAFNALRLKQEQEQTDNVTQSNS